MISQLLLNQPAESLSVEIVDFSLDVSMEVGNVEEELFQHLPQYSLT